MRRVFILSPANSAGERAQLLFNPRARFDLARDLQAGERAPLGEVFSFLSGLYFRGKRVYAEHFANPPARVPGALVITPNRGLLPLNTKVTLDELRAFSTTPIEANNPQYRLPVINGARALLERCGKKTSFVLLGSISTAKYVEPLLEVFGERLLFPSEFVGRGDMSRGGLLLRCVADDQELQYVPVLGAIRRGKRPAKLSPRSWGFKITSGRTPLPPTGKLKQPDKRKP